MSRYRLLPTPAQEASLRDHCAHARYIWNLAVEQHSYWRPGRASAPGHLEQCRQLTHARAEHPWLAAGSQMVQQQALRDFGRAMAAFFDPENPAGRPSWRKAGRDEGFRMVAVKPTCVRRLSRKTGEVWVPKAGWVRFRWSRAVPAGVKSYRVTMDRAGRWHVAFAAVPAPIPARCTACGCAGHADVNAARNIAAGHAVTARGGDGAARPVNREPQLLLQSA
jgi:transposase